MDLSKEKLEAFASDSQRNDKQVLTMSLEEEFENLSMKERGILADQRAQIRTNIESKSEDGFQNKK